VRLATFVDLDLELRVRLLELRQQA
jgi:hypothetical protein